MKRTVFSLLVMTTIVSCGFEKSEKEKFKTYFPTGELKANTEMEDGKKNGKEELYWKNGNLFMVQYFKDDLLIDSFYQYYENRPNVVFLKGYATAKSQITALDSSNNVVGISDYKSQMVADGLVKVYFSTPNNNIAIIGEYRNGKKDGIDITYFPNGNIKMILHYKNDIKVPPILEFDSTGKMIRNIPAKE